MTLGSSIKKLSQALEKIDTFPDEKEDILDFKQKKSTYQTIMIKTALREITCADLDILKRDNPTIVEELKLQISHLRTAYDEKDLV